MINSNGKNTLEPSSAAGYEIGFWWGKITGSASMAGACLVIASAAGMTAPLLVGAAVASGVGYIVGGYVGGEMGALRAQRTEESLRVQESDPTTHATPEIERAGAATAEEGLIGAMDYIDSAILVHPTAIRAHDKTYTNPDMEAVVGESEIIGSGAKDEPDNLLK